MGCCLFFLFHPVYLISLPLLWIPLVLVSRFVGHAITHPDSVFRLSLPPLALVEFNSVAFACAGFGHTDSVSGLNDTGASGSAAAISSSICPASAIPYDSKR